MNQHEGRIPTFRKMARPFVTVFMSGGAMMGLPVMMTFSVVFILRFVLRERNWFLQEFHESWQGQLGLRLVPMWPANSIVKSLSDMRGIKEKSLGLTELASPCKMSDSEDHQIGFFQIITKTQSKI